MDTLISVRIQFIRIHVQLYVCELAKQNPYSAFPFGLVHNTVYVQFCPSS